MATSRRVGSNEQILTYGASGFGRDFTSLATWEVATDTDHVADAETDVLECFDDASDFDDTVVMGGSTNNASFHRIIRVASGQGHDGTPNVGVTFRNTTASAIFMFRIDETFSNVQDLVLSQHATSASSTWALRLDGVDTKAIACLSFDGVNAGAGTSRGFRMTAEDTIVVNCMAVDGFYGFRASLDGGTETAYFYNCTAVDADQHGFSLTDAIGVAKNCLATGSVGGDDMETGEDWTGSTNNATGDATAQGASPRINQTFSFVAAGSDDFHLEGFDTGARDFGADLEADAFFDFDDDVDLEPFDVWDIGFDEPDPDNKPGVSGFQGFQLIDGEEWS